MKAILGAAAIAGLLAVAPACAQDAKGAANATTERKACEVPADLLTIGDSSLEKVAAAVKNERKLDVLVVGSTSSSLAGPDGAADS